MTDIEMIQWLRNLPEDIVCEYNYENCEDCPEADQCLFDRVIPKITDRMEDLIYQNERLKNIVDDMRNDHYYDYLDWYFQECWKLQEENEFLENQLHHKVNELIDLLNGRGCNK